MNCKHESTQTNFYVPQLFVYEWHKNNFFDMSSGMSDGLLDFVKVLMCLVVSAWMCVRFWCASWCPRGLVRFWCASWCPRGLVRFRGFMWVYYQICRVSISLIDSLRFRVDIWEYYQTCRVSISLIVSVRFWCA